MDERDWLAERFEEHRAHLRAVAYRMLGSLSEADDAVQEAWLRLSRTDTNEVENLGGWLTTVVARVSLNMLRSRKVRREEPIGVRMPDPIVDRADGTRPGARGAAGGLGRPGAARRARDAVSARAARVRAARHVRRAVRRDRADRRPLAGGGTSARQPRAPPRPGREDGSRRRPRALSVKSSTRFSRPRATATSRRCSRCSTRTSCCARTSGPEGGSREVRGARAVAGQALFYSRLGLVMQPALINGAAGAVGRVTESRTRSAPSRSGAGGSSQSTSSPTRSGSAGST